MTRTLTAAGFPFWRTAAAAVFVFLFVQLPVVAQESAQKEPVPDWLAWRMFQESLAHHARLDTAQPTPPPVQRGLPPARRLTRVELALKQQFGLAPEHTAALLSSGQTYLAALRKIQDDAQAEATRRYTTPQALAARVRAPRKTLLELSKEDGFHAEVEAKRQAALDAHLQAVSRSLTSAGFASVREWVRTAVADRIVVKKDDAAAAIRSVGPAAPVGR